MDIEITITLTEEEVKLFEYKGRSPEVVAEEAAYDAITDFIDAHEDEYEQYKLECEGERKERERYRWA